MGDFFVVEAKDRSTNARAGKMFLPHGLVKTPFYMPVATKGAVKTLSPHELEEIGYEIILSNTYHLLEKPGLKEIEEFGGLHRYMAWHRPILTDSGGYQVFSLHKMVKVELQGVKFRSLIDGKLIEATPEAVLDWQEIIGSDISMVLDVCTPYGISRERAIEALKITEAWAKRSILHWKQKERGGRRIFGIVQGNFFSDLRQEAAKNLSALDFDGFAVGGLSVGEPKEVMFEMSKIVASMLPDSKPRYFMGLGDPPSIVQAVAQGYDMFDSALATRIARGGSFYTKTGAKNIRNHAFKGKEEPLENECTCYTCKNFAAGYIRHLYLSEETLALRLLTYHNLYFMHRLMDNIRRSILDGVFANFAADFLNSYRENSE
jgi:queuine tRNA-ribosyltransferase